MRQQIRSEIRNKRKSLSEEFQNNASIKLVSNIINNTTLLNKDKFAIYLTHDGELNTNPLIEALWNLNKHVYLPVIDVKREHTLIFRKYHLHSQMTVNKYGIREPSACNDEIDTNDLDIIFTPLVAFDLKGNRLGMGGGFYDHTLKNYWNSENVPIPIGLAHDIQLVNELPTETWDVPLPVVITPTEVHKFSDKFKIFK